MSGPNDDLFDELGDAFDGLVSTMKEYYPGISARVNISTHEFPGFRFRSAGTAELSWQKLDGYWGVYILPSNQLTTERTSIAHIAIGDRVAVAHHISALVEALEEQQTLQADQLVLATEELLNVEARIRKEEE